VGIAAEPLLAQCPSGGCGSGPSPAVGGSGGGAAGQSGGIAGTGGGAARGCGCSGGSSASSSGGAARGTPPVIRAEAKPAWQDASASALETAAAEKRPIVVYFTDEADSEYAMIGEDLAGLSKTAAVFIKMPYNSDRSKSEWAEVSVVPVNKLLSDNPARDFGIKVGSAEVLLLDWFGNEFQRYGSNAKADVLKKHIEMVAKRVEDTNGKLDKYLEKAKEANAKSDRKDAVKYLMKNFRDGIVGMPAQEESIRLYRSIMDDARAEIESLAEKKDADGLKRLARELKKTDVEKTIDEAISKLG
jgi:hypothetical protein